MTGPRASRARILRRRLAGPLAVAAVAALLTGCTASGSVPSAGSASPTPSASPTGWHGLPLTGPAEPGAAPVPTAAPAGTSIALPAGTSPWGVAAAHDAGQVYVAARHQDRMVVVDMRSHAMRTVAVPGSARMIDLAAPDGPLLVPAEDKNTLYELSVPSLRPTGSAATRAQPHQAVVVGGTTFVSEEHGHAVGVVRGDRTVAQLTQIASPGGITAVDGRVAAVDVKANTLFVWDASTLRLLAALPAGAGPSHIVPIGGSRVAVCDVRGHAVLTYDLGGTPRALGRVAVPGRAFWVESDGRGTVYAALANVNEVARITTDGAGKPSLAGTLPTVRDPVSMDLDRASGTLWIAGYQDSRLQILPVRAFG